MAFKQFSSSSEFFCTHHAVLMLHQTLAGRMTPSFYLRKTFFIPVIQTIKLSKTYLKCKNILSLQKLKMLFSYFIKILDIHFLLLKLKHEGYCH